jgi:hypothetical protein
LQFRAKILHRIGPRNARTWQILNKKSETPKNLKRVEKNVDGFHSTSALIDSKIFSLRKKCKKILMAN